MSSQQELDAIHEAEKRWVEFWSRSPVEVESDLLTEIKRLQERVWELEKIGSLLYLTSRNHPTQRGCRIVDTEKLKPFQPGRVGHDNSPIEYNREKLQEVFDSMFPPLDERS